MTLPKIALVAVLLGSAPALAADPAPLPAQLSATVVIEPPRIEVGDAFDVEIAVVTPPDHHVPLAPVPKAIVGLWILEAARPEVERDAGRWIHRQRIRVRARGLGEYHWPALELQVTGPSGEAQPVAVPGRPFTVVSLIDEIPDPERYATYREPTWDRGDHRGPWLPALVGAAFALGAVALVRGVRRARSATSRLAPGGMLPATSGLTAQTLERLRHAGGIRDPVRAANLASLALREWAAERGRAPEILSATVEELDELPAPPALAGRYAGVVDLIRELDGLRFPPVSPEADARTRDTIRRTLAWVAGASRPA